ncbi:MAG: SRPBCC domain-containing protein [Bacteroidales bacterium]|nr:SRPBCC domain-containing protein [Bacteroidales bacterium]
MKDFKKYYIIPAEPEEVFIAITNPFTIELWTGYKAIMDSNVDTEFSLWEGDITGKNLEIIDNKKVVQEWYFEDQSVKSIVTINLFDNKKGTQVELIHKNIPDEDYENIIEGWNEYYFGAIKSFFETE